MLVSSSSDETDSSVCLNEQISKSTDTTFKNTNITHSQSLIFTIDNINNEESLSCNRINTFNEGTRGCFEFKPVTNPTSGASLRRNTIDSKKPEISSAGSKYKYLKSHLCHHDVSIASLIANYNYHNGFRLNSCPTILKSRSKSIIVPRTLQKEMKRSSRQSYRFTENHHDSFQAKYLKFISSLSIPLLSTITAINTVHNISNAGQISTDVNDNKYILGSYISLDSYTELEDNNVRICRDNQLNCNAIPSIISSDVVCHEVDISAHQKCQVETAERAPKIRQHDNVYSISNTSLSDELMNDNLDLYENRSSLNTVIDVNDYKNRKRQLSFLYSKEITQDNNYNSDCKQRGNHNDIMSSFPNVSISIVKSQHLNRNLKKSVQFDNFTNFTEPYQLTRRHTTISSRTTSTKSDTINNSSDSFIAAIRQTKASIDSFTTDQQKCMYAYVLICKCIAFQFNCEQVSMNYTLTERLTTEQFGRIVHNVQQNYLARSDTPKDYFYNCLSIYFDKFLSSKIIFDLVHAGCILCIDDVLMTFSKFAKSELIKKYTSVNFPGGSSTNSMIDKQIKADHDRLIMQFMMLIGEDDITSTKVRSTSTISDSNTTHNRKEVKTGFNLFPGAFKERHYSERFMSTNDLYEMTKRILNISESAHKRIYDKLQLDCTEKQAAVIRRELDDRLRFAELMQMDKSLVPKLIDSVSEDTFIIQYICSVNALIDNFNNYSTRRAAPARSDFNYTIKRIELIKLQCGHTISRASKLSCAFKMKVKILLHQIKDIPATWNGKSVFCTMQLGNEKHKLRTQSVPVERPIFECEADFSTRCIIPCLKIKLYVDSAKVLNINYIKLAKCNIDLYPSFTRVGWWTEMPNAMNQHRFCRLHIDININSPDTLKMCGNLDGALSKVNMYGKRGRNDLSHSSNSLATAVIIILKNSNVSNSTVVLLYTTVTAN
ncbi:hypothetical protein GJ496_003103 [Pomphorhynchus laevis]|nr:hypothetical protein GJ496_003103 [Pomphorhynchus laevis]